MHGITMLEVMGLVFQGGEVKKAREGVPAAIDVRVEVAKITPSAPDAVLLDFTYAVDYKPDLASLRISGQAMCKDSPDNVKRLLAEFKKQKAVPADLGNSVINMINANAGMNSIFILRPFNLLPPFMPPLLAQEQKPAAAAPSKKK